MGRLPSLAAFATLALACGRDGVVLSGPDGAVQDASEAADALQPIDAEPAVDAIFADAVTTVSATAEANAGESIFSLWADTGAVYWATADSVVRWDRFTSATLTLSSTEEVPLSLVGDGAWLYWTAYGTIRRVADDAPGAQTFIAGLETPYHLALDPDELFWSDFAGEIRSVPLPAGAPTSILANGLESTTGIALTADNVYFTEIGAMPKAVRRISKSPPGSPIIPITAATILNGIITGGEDTIFWVQDGTLYRYYEGVGGLVEPIVHESFAIAGARVVGDRVFWIVDGGGVNGSARLRGMPIRGTAAAAETYADDFPIGNYTEIRPGGGELYWFSGRYVWSARYATET